MGLEKVVKIWQKHFSAIVMGNDKNCVQKSVGMFQVQNRVIRARFSTLPASVVPGPQKLVKIWPKHFSIVLTGNDKNFPTNYEGIKCGYVSGKNRVIWSRFSTLPISVVPEPKKVVKIRPRHFSAVLMGNDKNCIQKSVGIIRVKNRGIRALFSTLPAPVVPRFGKVVKIRPKHFSAVLMENDKNCVQKSVGMFRVQNRLIRARWYRVYKNSLKFYWNIFQSYWQETIRTTLQTMRV